MGEFDDLPAIEPGLYQHYKGNRYRVLGVGCNTEAHEYYVAYSPENPKDGVPEIWLRPFAMFVETVTVDGKTVPRFKKLAD
jgi:hypothetical protein